MGSSVFCFGVKSDDHREMHGLGEPAFDEPGLDDICG